jgi:hypothetical protein
VQPAHGGHEHGPRPALPAAHGPAAGVQQFLSRAADEHGKPYGARPPGRWRMGL